MGRAKLKMELISKERSRNLTFKKRKEGLMRKLHEFTTLCDVSACMIIYGPKQVEKGAVEPEIWPQNPNEIRRIIDLYKAKNKDSGNKTCGLSDFFHDRKRKVEEELAKLRKENMGAKYPAWLDFLNFLTEAQLREFAAALNNKAQFVKSRIEFLKRKKQGLDMNNLVDFAPSRLSQSHSFYILNQQEFASVEPIDLHSMNQNSMMMMQLMNENDQSVQFLGASTSGSDFQCASFEPQLSYESVAGNGLGDPTMPLAPYFAPPVLQPTLSPPYMQCPMTSGVALPQLQFSSREHDHNYGSQEDTLKYLEDFLFSDF